MPSLEKNPQKYSYSYRLDPEPPKRDVMGDFDEKELQAYIDALLNVEQPKKQEQETNLLVP